MTSLRRWTAALLLMGLVGCGEDEDSSEPDPSEAAVTVQSWTVGKSRIDSGRSWIGRLEPLRTFAVQSPGAGRVRSVQVRNGDPVQVGDLLLRLEGTDLEARQQALEERVEQLQEEYLRWQRLQGQGAAGPGEVAAARLRLLEARETLDALDATAEAYQLRAPVSGRVHGLVVGNGVQVADGQLLLRVDDDSSWGVRLQVPAGETTLFEELDPLHIVDGQGNELAVERVVLTSDEHPVFVEIEIFVSEVDRRDRGSASVRYREESEVLIVPWTAVASDDDRHWVARIIAGDPDRIERTDIELGRPSSGGIEVRSGLQEGDRVIRFEPRSHPDGRAVRSGDHDDEALTS